MKKVGSTVAADAPPRLYASASGSGAVEVPALEPISADAATAWLNEAAHYFSSRPTHGEDAEHWSNVANAANCRRIAALIATDRDARQRRVYEWAAAAFGEAHASSVGQRGLRLVEEAIEAYQAAGGNREQARLLVDYIFDRPAGELSQELGGVGLTLLAFAQAAGVSADDAERAELDRVLSKPLAWFHARNAVKNAAGFEHGAYPNGAPKAGNPPPQDEAQVTPSAEEGREQRSTPSSSNPLPGGGG